MRLKEFLNRKWRYELREKRRTDVETEVVREAGKYIAKDDYTNV